jgi:hypothetical protein
MGGLSSLKGSKTDLERSKTDIQRFDYFPRISILSLYLASFIIQSDPNLHYHVLSCVEELSVIFGIKLHPQSHELVCFPLSDQKVLEQLRAPQSTS